MLANLLFLTFSCLSTIIASPLIITLMDQDNNTITGNHMDNLLRETLLDSESSVVFGTTNGTLITAQVGTTAFLPCRVHSKIDWKMVVWIHWGVNDEPQILSVGSYIYTANMRVQVQHEESSEDWPLRIKSVTLRDAGFYECQVSLHPPQSIFINLTVLEAQTEIDGPALKYVQLYSPIRLHCRLVNNTVKFEFLFWYHNERMINYDKNNGINITMGVESNYSDLIIHHAQTDHSGNYTCAPSNMRPASVIVVVLQNSEGDSPAAMYGAATILKRPKMNILLLYLLILPLWQVIS
ncbi:Ig-like domain-containing protein [Sergentomyia squamirostris]